MSKAIRWPILAFTVVLALSACTAQGDSGTSPDNRPGQSEPSPAASGGGSVAPDSAAPGSKVPEAQTEGAETARAEPDQPLVLAVHHSSRLENLPLRRARQVIAGRSPWEVASGSSRAAIREVADRRAALAVVPASVLGPEVRALRVDGIDPVRQPASYPLRTPAAASPGPVVRVSVVGDIMLGRGVAGAARESGHPAPTLRPTARRLSRADLTLGNLESTLSTAGAPTQGGDSFSADPRVVAGLREAGFDVLGLANNHVGDFGDRALVQTVRRLRAAGISTFGAGRTVHGAWRPAIVERRGVRFGVLGFNAIGETPVVGPGRPGAVAVGMPPRTGPLDRPALRRFTAAVRRLDRRVDLVVAMPHWGTQYTNRPEPVQHRVARRLVRAGVDVVVGGHPHWLQGAETVRERLVVHSLGNFVFDMDFMRQTMEGAILELTFWGDELKAADFVPYVMDEEFAPRVVRGRRGEQVLDVMREASGPAFRPRD